MVAGQVLGQLETAALIGALHATDHAGVGQHRKVAVRRALRHAAGGVQDLRHGQRSRRPASTSTNCCRFAV